MKKLNEKNNIVTSDREQVSVLDMFNASKKEKLVSSKISSIINIVPEVKYKNTSSDNNISSIITKSLEVFAKDKKNKKDSTEEDDDFLKDFPESVFKDLSIPRDRLNRYALYNEVYTSVHIVKRIFNVYHNNVFQKDPLSGDIFAKRRTRKTSKDNDYQRYEKILNKIVKFFKLEDRVPNICLFNSLKFGDSYIEVVDLEHVDIDFPLPEKATKSMDPSVKKKYMQESSRLGQIIHDNINIYENTEYKLKSDRAFDKLVSIVSDIVVEFEDFPISSNLNVMFEDDSTSNDSYSPDKKDNGDSVESKSHENESLNSNKSSEDKNKADVEKNKNAQIDDKIGNSQAKKYIDGFDDEFRKNQEGDELDEIYKKLNKIVLKFHKPDKIIPLYTPYDNLLGYLEIKLKDTITEKEIYNPLKSFINTVHNVGGSNKKISNTSHRYESTIKKFTDELIRKLLMKLKIIDPSEKNPTMALDKAQKAFNESVKSELTDTLYYTLKRILVTSDEESLFNKKVNIRFIPADVMFAFTIKSSENYPFGQSIIDPIIYPAKLYLLSQLSNVINRLSRSAIIRKWTIDVGTNENTASILEKVKQSVRNQKISGQDILGSKDVVKLMSDFKDMVVFTRKGTSFLDMSLEKIGDTSSVYMQDIEALRKDIVAMSGVPASYLGYSDMADLREQLVHVNIAFATEISKIQDVFNTQINRLMDKISSLIGLDDVMSNHVKLMLVPPAVLTLQVAELTINQINSIYNTLSGLQVNGQPAMVINPQYLFERFIYSIDWAELVENSENWYVEKMIKDKNKAQQDANEMNAANQQGMGGMGGIPGQPGGMM